MTEPRIPRFVKVVAAIILGGLGAVSFTAWQVHEIRREEEQRDCRRAVAGRDDNRAMWLYIIGVQDPERRDDPDFIAFVRFLNEQLPPLTCVGGDPIPIPGTTEGP